MHDREIERYMREDMVGHRPTWPMGMGKAGRFSRAAARGAEDPFDMFTGSASAAEQARARARRAHAASPEEEAALNVLELDPPVTLQELKARYKELAKRLHPDANGGDTHAEERLKAVNLAYTTLKSVLGDRATA